MPDRTGQGDVEQHRAFQFWFARRQPRYIAEFTERWGEWWDDKFREAEEDEADRSV